jgi:hypothetical protein
MLLQKLMGATASRKPLEFVGGAHNLAGETQTPTFSLTALSGGVDSSPMAGDLVVACVAFKDATNRDIQCTTSGYSEAADLYANSTNDCQLGVYRKVLTAADTSVSFDLGDEQADVYFVAHVWRNTYQTNPIGATAAITNFTSGIPDAPGVITTFDNAVVIAIGACAGSITQPLTALTSPSGMSNLLTTGNSNEARLGIASILLSTAGSYNPPAFGGGSASSANSFCAVTLALRPE